MRFKVLFVALALTLTAAAQDSFFIMLGDSEGEYWTAEYDRTLSNRTGWTDGDRVQYRCAYMFLMHRGRVVGRVTFVRVPGASYAAVNDKYMEDAVRWYDGTLNTTTLRQLECPNPTVEYEPYTGPDQRPVVTYNFRGTVLETRDYRPTIAGAGIKFRLVDSTEDRVTVVAYKNDLPVVVVYYDSMVDSLNMSAQG